MKIHKLFSCLSLITFFILISTAVNALTVKKKNNLILASLSQEVINSELPDKEIYTENKSVVYNVREYGAKGTGKTPDTEYINKAIDAAASAGGGTVFFPAGTYLSFSIHMKSNITLYLDQGAIILAADPSSQEGGYDEPEPNIWGDSLKYQDFGHSHWHNSLIWGENLENISFMGPGKIDGRDLTRSDRHQKGSGNKAIALKLCRNVIIRDITFSMCGHFCILATGVDNLTVDNIKIDSNRDGINIDCCNNVRISNCSVNTPNDDAIVLKSSYGLGYACTTENVTITNCQVSGYDPGTFLDGTFQRNQKLAPDRGGVTGRIKFGTESNGGFRNITISNCVFDNCRGLALESVDGGFLEDVTITNITMRDIVNAPFFLRLGKRMRGPEGTPVGKLRRVIISNVVVYNADPRSASLIMGVPGHDVEDVLIENIRILMKGGAPKEKSDIIVPELEDAYPDPRFFGEIPAYGFFIRHVNGLSMSNISVSYMDEDFRPPFILEDVKNSEFNRIKAQHAEDIPTFILKNVNNIGIFNCRNINDVLLDEADYKKF